MLLVNIISSLISQPLSLVSLSLCVRVSLLCKWANGIRLSDVKKPHEALKLRDKRKQRKDFSPGTQHRKGIVFSHFPRSRRISCLWIRARSRIIYNLGYIWRDDVTKRRKAFVDRLSSFGGIRNCFRDIRDTAIKFDARYSIPTFFFPFYLPRNFSGAKEIFPQRRLRKLGQR